jgi:hypothetical protein
MALPPQDWGENEGDHTVVAQVITSGRPEVRSGDSAMQLVVACR